MKFKTDTGKIWYGGAWDVPAVANEFASLSTAVDNARTNAPDFTSKAASGAVAALGSEWKALASSLQQAMAKTSTNLHHTGKALVEFAEQADDADTAAANEITRLKKDLEDQSLPHIRPTYPKDK